jgi:hypothetical protein
MPRDPFADFHQTDNGCTDEEWSAEIARRLEELDSGTAETTGWEEAKQRIQGAGERVLRVNRSQE